MNQKNNEINEPNKNEIFEIKNLINSNKLVEAETKAKTLIKKYHNSHTVLNILGVSLISQKKFEEAKKIYKNLIKIKPDYSQAYNNLGSIYMQQNLYDDAINFFEIALKKNPDLKQANLNLSKIYSEFGDSFLIGGNYESARKNYNLAIYHDKKNISAYNNLGNIFLSSGKINEAKINYEKAIEIDPEHYQSHSNLGIVLNNLGDFENSIDHYETAIKIRPDFEEAYNNLAISLVNSGDSKEATEIYNKILKLNPKKTQYSINANLTFPIIPNSNDDLDFWRQKYISGIKTLKENKYSIDDPQNQINPPAFNLSYSEVDNCKILKDLSNLFRNIIPIINFKTKNTYNLSKSKNLKIKIGFISEFFTDHSIGKLYRGLIKKLDRKKFEVLVFHLPKTKKGNIKNEIDIDADKVISLKGKIENQQQEIERFSLDFIFYPDIGMSSSTYFLAHSRLAPIQIMSWGHPETSGIDTIDYFISSTFIEKDNADTFYSEKLIRLKRIPMYFIPPTEPKEKLSRHDFNLPDNKNLYCCPQSLFKIHPDFDSALEKIVKEDKKSQIIMIESKYKSHKEKLKKRWKINHPLLIEKTIFLKSMSLDKFLSLIDISDVLLDPFYFGAGVSFSESMIFGTPTITMPGIFMRSRIAAGAYKQMNVSNPPVARNIDEYVGLAIKFANDKKRNEEMRKLLKKESKINLFNDNKALHEIENFLINSYENLKN